MCNPVGTRARWPGCNVIALSSLARKSMPALSGVPYEGRLWGVLATTGRVMASLMSPEMRVCACPKTQWFLP